MEIGGGGSTDGKGDLRGGDVGGETVLEAGERRSLDGGVRESSARHVR